MESRVSKAESTFFKNRWMAFFVLGFALVHCASLLTAMLPSGWGIRRAFEPYRELTGTEQRWGMFYTIPTMQSNAVTVEVGDPVETKGAILPGLKRYDVHASGIRYYYLLNQLTDERNQYSSYYLAQIKKEVGGERCSVRVESDFIRLPELVRKDGKMTQRFSRTLGVGVTEEK